VGGILSSNCHQELQNLPPRRNHQQYTNFRHGFLSWNRKSNISRPPLDPSKKPNSPFIQHKRHFRATKPVYEAKKDYYEVLGVSKNATEAEIKKAYFTLAKKYHPDMSKEPDAQKKFGEVATAYECLGNAEKRKQYDQLGQNAEQFEQAGYGPGEGFNPEDLLRQMFGGMGMGGMGSMGSMGGMGGMGGPRGFAGFDFDFGGMGTGRQQQHQHPQQQHSRKGNDIQIMTNITFMEAVNGCEKILSVKSLQPCSSCKGTGDKPGARPTGCDSCKGSGVQYLTKGVFQIEKQCQPCRGTGKTTPACNTCHGETLVEKVESVTVRIPAGVDSNTNVRLANQGDSGYHNGPRGHLWVKLNIGTDPRFRREGSDVHVTVPLSLTVAALGGVVDVPTLTGNVRLKIPPGTSQKDTQVMRNVGIKNVKKESKGHQYVHFDVQIPKNMSAKAKQLLEKFGKEMGDKDFNGSGK
jgi:molecular chaperone DnaJ